MRFPEDKIKEAILHPDLEIRDRATSYFAKSSFPRRFHHGPGHQGRGDLWQARCLPVIGLSRDLPQTEESIVWVIDELNDDQSDTYENYTYNLSMVLVEADPSLLLTNESSSLESRHFRPDLRPAFTERLRMISWDEATCWRNLEEFCEEAKCKQYTNEVDLGHAFRIVEALARHGQEFEERSRPSSARR